ncbi:site-specific DNA-methyltransferase [Caminibacter mediatlanticus]|uniref:site-specific DNA-methyltransferase (adenine-specific) n=1 Tax=Caminibacter mediatlanticus TB-2 TaxID=391592 RepID=A0AAI9AG70_9BACT|nr:site-specific DNA-methyltransferase [Caminibacter mediatlanticus]EDM23576.1 hypothetical protein CMTB2_04807 [Caminibacter mediatlanticus TB-2]
MKQEKLNNIQVIPSKIEELKKLFPEYFDKNGNFLVEKFTQDIQSQTNISKETYSLEWLGKSYARVLATEPVRTLLKENKEWNEQNKNSENLLIKGDNLEVLKHLVNAYENEIKMIYIDPPYNTENNDFVYQDDRKFTPEELSKLAGIDIEKAKRILDFLDSKSNSHSAWLTFMYPRLYIARRLLRKDGVIFISIDDNEIAQLKILMDEIFGEENFIAQFIRKTGIAARLDATHISTEQDYILCYSKNLNLSSFNKQFSNINKGYIYEDKHYKIRGKYKLNKLDRGSIRYSSSLDYPIESPDGTLIYPGGTPENNGWCWRWSKDKVEWGIKNDFIVFKKDKAGNWKVYFKQYQFVDNDNKPIKRTLPFKTLLLENYNNEIGSKEILELFSKKIFSYPKPTTLIKFLINLVSNPDNNDIILDFFAGSGTTGDAVMQLNVENGVDRKFILVQLPEPIDSKKNRVAYEFVKNELGIEYPTIYDITKERLIRSAKKIINDKENEIKEIKEEIEKIHLKEKLTKRDKEKIEKLQEELTQRQNELERIKKLDLSFKEFETIPIPEENLKDIEELTEELEENLFKPITDKNALLTTWKVFDGIKLHRDLVEMDFNGYKGYYLENKLYLIDEGFTLDNLASVLNKIHNEDFLVTKIVINGYVFNSKIQREIFESINNYNKKDLEKIELIIRY